MEIRKEKLKGYIDAIILAMLVDGDLYGYELAKGVKERTKDRFELKEGTLYLAFKRLEQAGLVRSYWGDESEGGRRKYYKLLPAGMSELELSKLEWEELKEIMDILLKGVK